MLNINDEDQEVLFRILESNTSFDSSEEDFSSSFNYCYQSVDESSSYLILKLVAKILVAMLLKLLMFSPRVKKMKVC